MREELINLREENKIIKVQTSNYSDQKEYELRKIKETNDRLNQQLAIQEQENKLLRKETAFHKSQLSVLEQEWRNYKDTATQMTKENKYLRDTIERLRIKYNDDTLTITSSKKERNTIYASLRSKEYKFDS